MAGNLQWTMGITDKMSGPARAMGGALDDLAAKLKTAGDRAAQLDAKKPGLVVNTPRHVRDDMAKQLAALEKSAGSDFAANMARHDGQRDAAALDQKKAKIDATTAAMNRYKAAVDRVISAESKLVSRSRMGKTDANGSGLFGQSKGAQSAVGRLAQGAGSMFGSGGANAVLGIARALDSVHASATKTRLGLFSLAGAGRTALSGLSTVGRGAVSVLTSVASAAAAAALAVGAIGIGLAAAGARYIASAQAFKSSMMFALAANLGGAKAAEGAWAKISGLAIATGNDLQQTATAFNGLLAGGFKLGEAEELMRLLADMKTLDPTANLEGIALAIKQIKMTGKLQGDELNQLGNAVSVDAVYEELAKKLGKTKDEVIKLKEAGKISADDAIDAIKRATLNKTGMKAGGLAEAAASKTLLGNVMKAKAVIDTFVSGLKIDFSPVARFLERLQKVLTGDAGTRFGKSVETGMNTFIGLLDGVSEKDIAAGFDTASVLILEAAGAAKDLAESIRTVDGWLESANSKTNTWGVMFSAVGGIVRGIGGVVGTVLLGPLYAIYDIVTRIIDAVDRAIGKLREMGKVPFFNATPGAANALGAGGGAPTGGGFEEAMRRVLGLGAGNQVSAATPAPAPGGPAAAGAAAAQAAATKTIHNTITVTANGLTFAQFEQKVGEIVEAKLAEQE